ncbi:hypothetical protein KO361_04760 [Candidatus Woesearchaeota archaeon]|nr:hypothetical protein [Candidatus Woesearchaeota archaeon]
MIRNKKGMEIAISTLVGIIIAALMLMAGIALFGNLIFRTNQISGEVDAMMEQELINAFVSNDPIYIHRNPLTPGKGEDSVIFGVGIHNIYNTPRNFTMSVSGNDDLVDENILHSYMNEENFTIARRDKAAVFVIVPVKDLPKGQHSVTLEVKHYNGSHWNLHDNKKLLYINK